MNKIGVIGLGKMGYNLIQNINNNGFKTVGFDQDQKDYKELENKGISTALSLKELVEKIEKPRSVIMIVPSGKTTENVFQELLTYLEEGDIILDAGNSFYKDTLRRYEISKKQKINYIDLGTSGGPAGALDGACLMVGGEEDSVKKHEDLFQKISLKGGYLHTGRVGSGHFAKMIHNGIEYGMMQAIAEGYDILENSQFDFDYEKISNLWNNGSVIRSWLIELMKDVFSVDPKLEKYTDIMEMNGEGLWTLEEALKQGTPAPVIGLSVMMRQSSQIENSFSGKVVTALRNAFGGHPIPKK